MTEAPPQTSSQVPPAPARKVSVPLGQRELLRASEVMAIFGWKRSKFYEHLREYRIPQPVEVGETKFWRRRELADWVDAGAPNVGMRGDHWKWEPGVRMKLSIVHAQMARQLSEMRTEWNLLDELLKKGDRIINLRSTQ